MSEEEPLKVILLGNSGVGKSNLIARFHNNDFSEDFESTVGVEFVTKRITVDGVPVKLQIWDTAGQERYASMMKTYYRKAKGSLLVYDVTNRSSFVGLEAWRKHLEANADPRCVSIVAGNKSDVSDQLVSPKDGEAYARQRGMAFISTSAKTGDNVEEAFVTLARNILRAGQGRPSTGQATSHRLHGKPHPQGSQDCC
ncbi:unnamed protein product [Ectocarpus sp. CCAP 1310/34]|nr:unnamed protein product [Ectocarpus sp. CCAP 1310/34]